MPASMDESTTEGTAPKWTRSWRFWGVFAALCLLSFMAALDVTIVGTALPTITKDIGGEHQYVWIANSFILASSAPQPLFGQLSNVFGRRNPVLLSIVLFALGSGLAGGAFNPAMLIAGRSVQGVGAGGIYVLIDIICCDLVPLRERGKYLGLMFSFAGLGAAIGPVVGGALALVDWRLIFYLNLGVAGLALAFVVLFLRVKASHGSSDWRSALSRVDFVGGALFVLAMTSILLALITGGVQYPWSSFRIIVPLVLGILGWIAFHIHQAIPSLCPEPTVPPRLFLHRTSAAALFLTFIGSCTAQAAAYFLPVYFQAIKGTSALDSGVNFLPFAIPSMFFAVVGGAALSKTGLYRPLHLAAFALSAIGLGLFSAMDATTSRAAWAGYQIIAAAGSGIVQSTLLPAIMAALADADTAVASATYSFAKTFGQIWGLAVASIAFNNAFTARLDGIGDPALRAELARGAAYADASQRLVAKLPEGVRAQVVGVYVSALRTVWVVFVGLSCFSCLCVLVERDLKLRDQLKTEYGLTDGEKEEGNRVEAGSEGEKSEAQGTSHGTHQQ